MSFRIAMIVIFAAWPVIAFVTGLAFSPLIVVAGVMAVFSLKRWPATSPAVLCLAAFLVWAMISATWSPNADGLLSGSLVTGDFAVQSAGLRVVPVALAGLFALVAATRLGPQQATELGRVGGSAILVHAALLGIAALLFAQIIDWLAPFGDSVNEGHQNLIRSANLFALAFGLSIGLSPLHVLRPVGLAVVIGVASVGALLVCLRLDAQGAAFGLVLGPLVFVLINTFGFRVLCGLLAVYVLAAPLIVRGVHWAVEAANIALPASFQARVWGWQVVADHVGERPLLGHGLEAAETWTDTYAAYPDWLAQVPENWARYPVIPGHPHNTPLQIWAETGAVGATLAAAAVALLGWTLPRAKTLPLRVRIAASGLIGGWISHISFAYDLWNDAYWAAVAIVGVGVVALWRSQVEA